MGKLDAYGSRSKSRYRYSGIQPQNKPEFWQRQEPTKKNATFSKKSLRTPTCSIVSFGSTHAERGKSFSDKALLPNTPPRRLFPARWCVVKLAMST